MHDKKRLHRKFLVCVIPSPNLIKRAFIQSIKENDDPHVNLGSLLYGGPQVHVQLKYERMQLVQQKCQLLVLYLLFLVYLYVCNFSLFLRNLVYFYAILVYLYVIFSSFVCNF